MNDSTELLRQIHPSFVQGDRVTTQAFRPTPKDHNKLSTYDGSLISAESAWRHFTNRSFTSAGVKAVLVAECKDLALGILPDPEEFPEHVLLDFHEASRKDVERKAKVLRAHAVRRGWLFRA